MNGGAALIDISERSVPIRLELDQAWPLQAQVTQESVSIAGFPAECEPYQLLMHEWLRSHKRWILLPKE